MNEGVANKRFIMKMNIFHIIITNIKCFSLHSTLSHSFLFFFQFNLFYVFIFAPKLRAQHFSQWIYTSAQHTGKRYGIFSSTHGGYCVKCTFAPGGVKFTTAACCVNELIIAFSYATKGIYIFC